MIGKRLHVVTFSFTLLDEGQRPCSYEGNHVLAVLKEPEKYDTVKNALADIIAEVERLDTIDIDGITFHIEYHLSGDWKFLAMATGIDCATSTYACIWCKCKNDIRHDPDKVWSITDIDKGVRTTEETLELSQHPRSKKQFNVSNSALFPTIPLTHVVIDNLHLFLRVSNVLLNLSLNYEDKMRLVK